MIAALYIVQVQVLVLVRDPGRSRVKNFFFLFLMEFIMVYRVYFDLGFNTKLSEKTFSSFAAAASYAQTYLNECESITILNGETFAVVSVLTCNK
jgi:hypothetical protein